MQETIHGINLSVNSLTSLIDIMPLFRQSSRRGCEQNRENLAASLFTGQVNGYSIHFSNQRSLFQVYIMFLTVLFISWCHTEGYKRRLKLDFLLQYFVIYALSTTVTKQNLQYTEPLCVQKTAEHVNLFLVFAHNYFRQQLNSTSPTS